jgi:hypothetical protein
MNLKRDYLESVTDIRNYLFAGKAEFTLQSNVTGKHYTYRVLSKTEEPNYPVKFLYVLSGSNNDSDWSYAGTVRMLKNNPSHEISYNTTPKAQFTRTSPAIIALRWLIWKLNKNELSPDLSFLHSGKCSACGRKLTDPESIRSGMGKICRGRL